MWFSKPKPPVELEEFEWLLACFAWVHRKMVPGDSKVGFLPILARHDTPEIAEATGASSLFLAVKSIAGLKDWYCELQQGEAAFKPDIFSALGEISSRSALGTFRSKVIHQ